jgi:hypothetical protein
VPRARSRHSIGAATALALAVLAAATTADDGTAGPNAVPASQADSCDRPTPRDWSRGATVANLPETGFRCQIQFFHTGVVLTPHPDGPIGQRADS